LHYLHINHNYLTSPQNHLIIHYLYPITRSAAKMNKNNQRVHSQDAVDMAANSKGRYQDDEDLKADHNMSCYENTINCCGGFWGTLRTWLPCCFFCCPYP